MNGCWKKKKERVSFFLCLLASMKTQASIHGNSYDCFEESQMTVFLKPVH